MNQPTKSVNIHEIPAFLHISELYLSLNKDDIDSSIDIPVDFCFFDSKIRDLKQLDSFLQTVRFWGLKVAPNELWDFVTYSEIEVSEYWPVMRNYEKDLPFLSFFRSSEGLTQEERLLHAIRERNFVLFKMVVRQGITLSMMLIDEAVSADFHQGLRWFCKKGLAKEQKTTSAGRLAIELDKLESLQILCESGFYTKDFGLDALQGFAVEFERRNCLSYLKEQNEGLYSPEALLTATRLGNLEMITHLLAHGLSWSKEAVLLAVKHNHLTVLELAVHQHRFPLPEDAVKVAFLHHRTEIMQWLLQQPSGSSSSSSSPSHASSSTLAAPISTTAVSVTSLRTDCPRALGLQLWERHNTLCRLAASVGCGWERGSCRCAVREGYLEMHTLIHTSSSSAIGTERGKVGTMQQCKRGNQAECFKYMLKHQVTPRDPVQATLQAARLGYITLLSLLLKYTPSPSLTESSLNLSEHFSETEFNSEDHQKCREIFANHFKKLRQPSIFRIFG